MKIHRGENPEANRKVKIYKRPQQKKHPKTKNIGKKTNRARGEATEGKRLSILN